MSTSPDDTGDTDGPAEELVLEFPTWQTEEPGVSEWWRDLIAEYEEEHEHITINQEPVPFDQFVDTMLTRFSTDDPPDIVHLPSRNFAQFASQEFLAPMDDYLAETDILDDWTDLQEEMVWDGEHQGLLLLGYGYLLFYNEALLADADVEVPTTPEELVDAIAAFDDRQEDGFGLTTTSHPNVYTDVATFVYGAGTTLEDGDQLTVDSPEIMDAVEMYRSAAEASPPGVDSGQKRQIFINGDMAMMIDGPFVLATVEQEASADIADSLKVAVPPFPVTPGGSSNSLHIPAGLDDATEQAVWDFIELAASPEWQERYVELYQVPPARLSTEIPDEIADEPNFQVMIDASQDVTTLFPTDEGLRANFGQIEQRIVDAMVRLTTGDDDTANVLEDLQQQLDDDTQ